MAEALLALGGNVGDVRATLDRAVAKLCDGVAVRLLARSSDYRTPPWGVTDQPPFINLCIAVATSLTPQTLFGRAQGVEHALGRDRAHERRWGPRTIDIDLLAYDDLAVATPELTLPHPRLFERAFVLLPLAEIVPERLIAGIRVRDALARVDQTGIERLPPRADFPSPSCHFATMADDLTLAAEFAPATREDWLKLVRAALKDRPYEKLIARTYDGLAIEPLSARAAKAQPIAARRGAWQVLSRVDHPDPAAANAEALHELENGANGLVLICVGSTSANGFGIDGSVETLGRVLDGVYLDAGVTIDLQVGIETRNTARHFAALVRDRKIPPASVDLLGGLNPIGGMAATGGSVRPWRELAPYFAELVGDLAGDGFRGPFAVADGRVIHNAGGSEAQELAFVLASAVTYLRALEASGVGLDAARGMIYFRLAADAEQFLTIAKFRALRKLWARVEAACGLAPRPTYVSAETAWRMMTRRDPWVNMLRTTIAAFSAGLGGADAITVLPFTAALGLPDRFARRIARNAQLLLLEESNLARVADPAAGSGGIEALTEQLCGAAWALFQEIESAGGAAEALAAGRIQEKVAKVRAERESAVTHRKDVLTGTSDFPDLAAAPVKVLDIKPATATPYPAAIKFEPLPRLRLAEPFERLRDTSDRLLAATGARPKIFLVNLGALADFNARGGFAKNFFEAGGIETVTNEGFAGQEKMVTAFKSSGARLVCLCSSDEIYAKEAAEAAKALSAADARHIYLVGRPREHEAAFKAAGVGTFIFAGCDAVSVLTQAYQILQ